MNYCKFYPEITNCIDCDYFEVLETGTDFKVICHKYEEETMDEHKQTFAEWYFKYSRAYPNCTITLRRDFGFMNDFVMQMTDLKNVIPIGAQQVIRNELLEQSDRTGDEILIFCAQKLRKELDKYGS